MDEGAPSAPSLDAVAISKDVGCCDAAVLLIDASGCSVVGWVVVIDGVVIGTTVIGPMVQVRSIPENLDPLEVILQLYEEPLSVAITSRNI